MKPVINVPMDNQEHILFLQEKYKNKSSEEILSVLIKDLFKNQIALVSSFGAESALLLDMVAGIDPALPVIFLDTGKLFPETLTYKETLIKRLGLKNVITFYPDYTNLMRNDSNGNLWQQNPNSCCYIRKVEPLSRALKGYNAWITGRKRFQGGMRGNLPLFEVMDGRIKVNPLATWSPNKIKEEFTRRNLALHPLFEKGYLSIGCMPCTDLPADKNDPRSGRWKDSDKQECGIHLGEDGRYHRGLTS